MIAPGPKGHWLVGNLPELRRDPLGFLTMCARDYGDVARYRVANVTAFLVNHPDHIEYVLTHHGDFSKGRLLQANRFLFGNGLLTREGDEWQRARRLVQPAFHRERVNAYADLISAHAQHMMATWREGETRDIHHDMQRVTLAIATQAFFAADVSADATEIGDALTVFLQEFSARVNTAFLIPPNIPTLGNARLRRALRRLETIVYRIIHERRASEQYSGDPSTRALHPAGQAGSGCDVLSLLLQARDDNGDPLSDRQLRDEVMTFFLAGHATTDVALAWTWYLLAQHADVEAQLLAELRAVLGERTPTAAAVSCLPYTAMVVKEAMRLYPPVWGIPRVALRDFEMGGYHIPTGASVTMSQWVMHHDARYFERPDEFDPSRWTDERMERLPRFAYFPFGGGPRVCIGQSFAMMEIILLVATIARQFHFTLPPGQRVTPWPSFTLQPKEGVNVVLSRRA